MSGRLLDRLAALPIVFEAGTGGLRYVCGRAVLTPEREAWARSQSGGVSRLVSTGNRSRGVLPEQVEAWDCAAREAFEERAAIREFEAGATRSCAEELAEWDTRLAVELDRLRLVGEPQDGAGRDGGRSVA